MILSALKPATLSKQDATFFEQRTFHSIARNWSGFARKTIFVGFDYSWVKPMEYLQIPYRLDRTRQSRSAPVAGRRERCSELLYTAR
mgnify:CR=1 FL=1